MNAQSLFNDYQENTDKTSIWRRVFLKVDETLLGEDSNAFISTSSPSWTRQKPPWCCSFSCGLLNTQRSLTFRKGQALNTSPGNRVGLIKLQQWRILNPQTPGSEREETSAGHGHLVPDSCLCMPFAFSCSQCTIKSLRNIRGKFENFYDRKGERILRCSEQKTA